MASCHFNKLTFGCSQFEGDKSTETPISVPLLKLANEVRCFLESKKVPNSTHVLLSLSFSSRLTFSIQHGSPLSSCPPVLLSTQHSAPPPADFLEAPLGKPANRVASVLLIYRLISSTTGGYFAMFVIVLEMGLSCHVIKYQA